MVGSVAYTGIALSCCYTEKEGEFDMTTDFGGPMEIPLFCNFQHGTAKEERAICSNRWIGRHDHDPSIELSMPWRHIHTRSMSAIDRSIDIREGETRWAPIQHSQHTITMDMLLMLRNGTIFEIHDETIIKLQPKQEDTIIN